MGTISFADCANKEEIRRWIALESDLVSKMSRGITAGCIADTACVFMVARQFPRRHPSERARDFDPVVEPLQRAAAGLSPENLVQRIDQLADDLATIPGLAKLKRGGDAGIRPVSASSKFVWTAIPDIGIIYDSRARTYLGYLGHAVPMGDYGAFVSAFRHEQLKYNDEIEAALVHIDPQFSGKTWIRAKLFDLWLYANGKQIASTSSQRRHQWRSHGQFSAVTE